MEVRDINEYIDTLEKRIFLAKSKGKKFIGDFMVNFQSDNMPNNMKTYLEQKGYSVELKKCQQCSHWDLVISWQKFTLDKTKVLIYNHCR